MLGFGRGRRSGPEVEKPIPFADAKELLASHFSDAYKMETDQRESIWRSIPGFVTGLGLYGALFGFIVGRRPEIDVGSAYSWVIYALATASAVSALTAFALLTFLLIPRSYKALALESEILTYLDESIASETWKTDYSGQPSSRSERNVFDAVQRLLIEDTAAAVSHNRILSRRRYQARGLSASFLLAAYILAIVPAFSVAWPIPSSGRPTVEVSVDQSSEQPPTATAAAAAAAAAASHADDQRGRDRPTSPQ